MGFIRFFRNWLRHDSIVRQRLDLQYHELYELHNMMQEDRKRIKIDELREKTLCSTMKGVSDDLLCEHEVIVSLTSFGKRIYDVHLAIESIMQGSVKPNRIILWLSEEEFKGKPLPKTLEKQKNRGLQIEYCEDLRSYKKIVPTMEKYPDACIVTIDDDLMYEFDLLENLINTHCTNPEDICACRMHRITLDSDNRPNGYMKWQWMVWPEDKSNLNFLTSGGGALFPPRCFVEEFFNREAFMSICPYADDVWINAMILMSGRQISKTYTHSKTGCDYVESYFKQDDALSKENTNSSNCRNDIQLKAVCEKYNLYEKFI
jgi:hypothetical protein